MGQDRDIMTLACLNRQRAGFAYAAEIPNVGIGRRRIIRAVAGRCHTARVAANVFGPEPLAFGDGGSLARIACCP